MTWQDDQKKVATGVTNGREFTLEDLMNQGVTRMLNGREVTFGYIISGGKKRIGWVWKDTGLPASMEKNT